MASANPPPQPSEIESIKRALTTVLTVAAAATTPEARENVIKIFNNLVSGVSEYGLENTVYDMVLRPAAYGLSVSPPDYIVEKAVQDRISEVERSINPEKLTGAQSRALRASMDLIQKLYNEKSSANPQDRADFEAQRQRILNRIRETLQRTGNAPLEEIIILDAVDHPEKYNLRVVTEAAPPGRPPSAPRRRGRPPKETVQPTVARKAEVPENIAVPVTAPEATAGPLTPRQPVPAPASELAKSYVNILRVLQRTNAAAYNDYVRYLRSVVSNPSVKASVRDAAREALQTFGLLTPEEAAGEIKVEQYLATDEGAEELARILNGLLSRPTRANLQAFASTVGRLRELMEEGTVEGARAAEVLALAGVEITPPPPPVAGQAEAPAQVAGIAVPAPAAGQPAGRPMPVFHVPENAPEDVKATIYSLAALYSRNMVQFEEIIKELLDKVIQEYRANPQGYMNSSAALILNAFGIDTSPKVMTILSATVLR